MAKDNIDFENLPDDMINYIIHFKMAPDDIFSLSKTNKRFHQLVAKLEDQEWYNICKRNFYIKNPSQLKKPTDLSWEEFTKELKFKQLTQALLQDSLNEKIIKSLLAKGLDPLHPDHQGLIPLQIMIDRIIRHLNRNYDYNYSAHSEQNIKILEMLLSAIPKTELARQTRDNMLMFFNERFNAYEVEKKFNQLHWTTVAIADHLQKLQTQSANTPVVLEKIEYLSLLKARLDDILSHPDKASPTEQLAGKPWRAEQLKNKTQELLNWIENPTKSNGEKFNNKHINTERTSFGLRVLKALGVVLACLTCIGALPIFAIDGHTRAQTGYGTFFDGRTKTQALSDTAKLLVSKFKSKL